MHQHGGQPKPTCPDVQSAAPSRIALRASAIIIMQIAFSGTLTHAQTARAQQRLIRTAECVCACGGHKTFSHLRGQIFLMPDRSRKHSTHACSVIDKQLTHTHTRTHQISCAPLDAAAIHIFEQDKSTHLVRSVSRARRCQRANTCVCVRAFVTTTKERRRRGVFRRYLLCCVCVFFSPVNFVYLICVRTTAQQQQQQHRLWPCYVCVCVWRWPLVFVCCALHRCMCSGHLCACVSLCKCVGIWIP